MFRGGNIEDFDEEGYARLRIHDAAWGVLFLVSGISLTDLDGNRWRNRNFKKWHGETSSRN